MTTRDMHNNIQPDPALVIQDIVSDTTTVGIIIDTSGFESVEFVILSGFLRDGAYVPLIQDGDDSGLSDAAAVSDTFLLGTESAASFASTDDDKTKRIGYVGKKRYVRLSIVSTSVLDGGYLSAVAIKGNPSNAPTSADA
jgi:hypothetical protein